MRAQTARVGGSGHLGAGGGKVIEPPNALGLVLPLSDVQGSPTVLRCGGTGEASARWSYALPLLLPRQRWQLLLWRRLQATITLPRRLMRTLGRSLESAAPPAAVAAEGPPVPCP